MTEKSKSGEICECVVCGCAFDSSCCHAKYCSDICREVMQIARYCARFFKGIEEQMSGIINHMQKLENDSSDLDDGALKRNLLALIDGHRNFTHKGTGALFFAHKLPEENVDVNEKQRTANDDDWNWQNILFQLDVRAMNVLASLNIRSLSELLQYTRGELSQQKNCGTKTIKQIEDALKPLGLRLRHVK